MHSSSNVGDATRTSQRAASKQATRRRIAVAARSRFLVHGYAATRLQDVATDAGVASATLYFHFASKRDLLLESVGELNDAIRTRYPLLEHVVADRDRAVLEDWLIRTLGLWGELGPLVRVVDEAAATVPDVRSHLVDGFALGVLAITAGLGGGLEAERKARLTMAIHQGVFHEFGRGIQEDAPALAHRLAAVWATTLFGA